MTPTHAASISAVIFVLTLSLVMWRPRGLNVAAPVACSAILLIAIGCVSIGDLKLITARTWDAALTLIALMMISATLDRNGFFEWAARWLLLKAKGSGPLAFIYVIVLTVLVTGLLANDGAILILTPIFCRMLISVEIPHRQMWPYLFAAGFLADAASTPLIASNLTNIIIADSFHITAVAFALRMFAPTAAVVVTAGLILYMQHRRALPLKYPLDKVPAPSQAIVDRNVFASGWAVLAAMAVGYPITGLFGLPVSLVAIAAAAALLAHSGFRRVVSVKEVVIRAPWYILAYAIGMFVIVLACRDAGLTSPLNNLFAGATQHSAANGLISGMTAAALSAVANNLPATLAGVLALASRTGTIGAGPPAVGGVPELLVYSMVLGVDVGAKFTPIGSLATLLWLEMLSHYGIKVRWRQYIGLSLIVTAITLIAALAALSLEFAVFSPSY